MSFFVVATGFYPLCHCRLSAHACGSNIPYLHLDFVISSYIPQPYILHGINIGIGIGVGIRIGIKIGIWNWCWN